jgi:hypothetical protein
MQDAQGSGELERMLAEHGGDLMRTAALLTGSRQDAEDLLQAALERLLRRGAGSTTRQRAPGAPAPQAARGHRRGGLRDRRGHHRCCDPGDRPGRRAGHRRRRERADHRVRDQAATNALAAENFVIQAQATGSMTVSVHGHKVRSSNGTSMSWSYGNRSRFVEFTGHTCGQVTPNGRCTHRGGSQLYLAEGTALVGGKLTGAYVTYFDHKYSLHPLGQNHVKACSRTAQLDLGAPAATMPNGPAFIKAMLGCGAATVTGHARIGGVETTVISGSIDVPLPEGYASAIKEARERVRYTLYVDSATYLPVRAYGSDETYGGANGPTVSASVTNVQWLPPTAANIAKAMITIPTGYTQVSSPAQQ